MSDLIVQIKGLLNDLKVNDVKRVHNPNMLVPTILMIEKSIKQVDEGKCIRNSVDLIESDLRSILSV